MSGSNNKTEKIMKTIDLRKLRETLRLSQEEFALKLSEDGDAIAQDQISRWERNPESIPAWILGAIQSVFGIPADQFYKSERANMFTDSPKFDNPFVRRTLMLNAVRDYLKEKQSSLPNEQATEKVRNVHAKLTQLVQTADIRPLIAFVGPFNSTKSSLINWLIGENRIPVGWTPTTPVLIFVVHRDYRPDHMEEDAVVHIFKDLPNDKSYRNLIMTRDLYKDFCLESGGYSLLYRYANHEIDRPSEVTHIIMFADAPILNACDLCDTPGYNATGEESDEALTSSVIVQADGYVFASLSNQFLSGLDSTRLNDIFASPTSYDRSLAPLRNLLIVFSCADLTGPETDDTIAKAIHRLWTKGVLSDAVMADWEERGRVTEEYLRSRVRPFSNRAPYAQMRETFSKALRSMMEELVQPILGQSGSFQRFKDNAAGVCDDEIAMLSKMLDDRDRILGEVQRMKSELPQAKIRLRQVRGDALTAISDSKKRSSNEFDEWWSTNCTVEAVEEIIRDRNWSMKDAREFLSEAFFRKAQNRMNKVTARHFEERCRPALDGLLKEYEAFARRLEITDPIGNVEIPFDFQGAAAAAFAGITTMGGLAIWAASLGSLGWYILTAKAVSVLAALGISISGGTAAAISTVAAFGGPVVWALVAVILLAIFVWRIFGKSWQRRMAEQFVKAVRDKHADEQFRSTMRRFFDETADGLSQFCEKLDEELDLHVLRLEQMAMETNPDRVRETIQAVEKYQDFFRDLPLKNYL
jgi:transcriptional regulator with XRE-family HTH domain